ncbi:MAG TPA: efflux transporter periplasmic adaptor subunit, partial [Thermoanaerobaculia bacterium]
MKRMILMLLIVGALVGALGMVKARQIKSGMAAHASFQPPPEAVTTAAARPEQWPSLVKALGTVTAVQGVTVSADLPGIVEKIY